MAKRQDGEGKTLGSAASNGDKSKIIFALLGIMQVLLGLAVVYWTGRVDRLDAKYDEMLQERQRLLQVYEGRVSTIEANYSFIRRELTEINAKLDTLR